MDLHFSILCSKGPKWRLSQQAPGKVLELKVQCTTVGGEFYGEAKTGQLCASLHARKYWDPRAPSPAQAAAPLLTLTGSISLNKLKQKASRFKIPFTSKGTLQEAGGWSESLSLESELREGLTIHAGHCCAPIPYDGAWHTGST